MYQLFRACSHVNVKMLDALLNLNRLDPACGCGLLGLLSTEHCVLVTITIHLSAMWSSPLIHLAPYTEAFIVVFNMLAWLAFSVFPWSASSRMQRSHALMRWSFKKKNIDVLIIEITYTVMMGMPPSLAGLWL